MVNLFWNTISTKGWDSTPPPWRPSFFNVLFFIYYILKFSFFKKHPHVLLVGATKEIREILSKLAIPYDLADFSKNMISLTKPAYKDTIKNVFLTDWKQFVPKKNEYDIILGDLIFNLLEREDVKALSHVLVGGLKRKGRIIFRTRTVTSDTDTKTVNMVRKQLKKMHPSDNYTIYANLQTLEKKFSLSPIQMVETELFSLSRGENTAALLFFKKTFLQSTLKYYLYSVSELESLMSNLTINLKHPYTPRGYLDTFSFIIISKQSN